MNFLTLVLFASHNIHSNNNSNSLGQKEEQTGRMSASIDDQNHQLHDVVQKDNNDGGDNDDLTTKVLLQVANATKETLGHGIDHRNHLPKDETDRWEWLQQLLIAANNVWDEDLLQAMDQVWAEQHRSDDDKNIDMTINDWIQNHSQTTVGQTHLALYRGDITKLTGVDAIVNAANEQGLGCFQPTHKCIDNVIHRAAGPRLRQACRQAMGARFGQPLAAGTPPIVTPGYHLPARFVVHVTGPAVDEQRGVTEQDRQHLFQAYQNTLDACVEHGIHSVAFNCISTGLFGYPQREAAQVAVKAVTQWLEERHSNDSHNGLDLVVFDVFTDADEIIYEQLLSDLEYQKQQPQISPMALAKTWIDTADAILIVAGAGMSVKEGEMVYVNADDFAHHYPWFADKWGYRTSYEVMGLGNDPSVPETAKWALHAQHMHNMRWGFTPNDGYEVLNNLVKDKDYFVLTSNVDGCFERSGFAKDRIYTPQGEWTYYQCLSRCRPNAVFESRPLLDEILPLISRDGFLPIDKVPHCPYCGGKVFGNVRGGAWFDHQKYESQNDRLRAWMKEKLVTGTKVVVIEVGAGFNTPTVTRFPAESFVRQLGTTKGSLIRINPSDPDVPTDLNAISFPTGWQILSEIAEALPDETIAAAAAASNKSLGLTPSPYKEQGDGVGSDMMWKHYRHHLGHFDWNRMLQNLKDE